EEWLAGLRKADRKGFVKCLDLILELERLGVELEMPHSKPLGGGIFELRTRHKKVRYRIFYFFTNRGACLSHGVVKKTAAVMQSDIDLVKERMKEVRGNPEK